MFTFGIAACWCHHRNLSVFGHEIPLDFLKKSQGFFREWEQLPLFLRFCPLGKQVLEMELDLFGERLTILTKLWLTVLSKEQNGFCPGDSPLFVHAHLKQFIHATSIGERKQS